MTAAAAQPRSTSDGLRAFAADIKLAHSVFAMPWALLSMCLAARSIGQATPAVGQIILIVVCMIAARTVAMTANRLLDARLDAVNPRTSRRALPSGRASARFFLMLAVACAASFIVATAGFGWFYANWLPLMFSLPVLALISAYPLLKRFTRWCHYYLGVCLALAPICAWIAIAGPPSAVPFFIAAAVLCWTAGFDIIYACQDYDSDRAHGVHSVPAAVGIGRALWISRGTHLLSIVLLVLLRFNVPEFGLLFSIAIGLAAALLLIEQSIVSPSNLSKVNLAFFTINGVISLLVGGLGIADLFY